MITLFQGDVIYALYGQKGLLRGQSGYTTNIMLNRMKLTNRSSQMVELKSCRIDFIANKKIIQSSFYDASWLRSEAKQAFDFVTDPKAIQFFQGVPFFQTKATSSLQIGPNESLFIFGQSFDLYAPQKIDQAEILCLFDQQRVFAKKLVKIEEFKTKNHYIAPMAGAFAIVGGPYESWGHRIKHHEEFGVDFQILDERLRPYSQNPFATSDHYCFGKEVMAPAAGTIVAVADGLADNPIPYDLKSNGELFKSNLKRFPFVQASGGNFVIIDHGQSEFSFLGHLQNGSIQVKAGDSVKQGRPLAKCGNSGAGSTSPHLHYHLMDHAQVAHARGLPVTFTNVQTALFGRDVVEKMGLPAEVSKIFSDMGFQLWETTRP